MTPPFMSTGESDARSELRNLLCWVELACAKLASNELASFRPSCGLGPPPASAAASDVPGVLLVIMAKRAAVAGLGGGNETPPPA